jgi:hypothetical protein
MIFFVLETPSRYPDSQPDYEVFNNRAALRAAWNEWMRADPPNTAASVSVWDVPAEPNRHEIAYLMTLCSDNACVSPTIKQSPSGNRIRQVVLIFGEDEVAEYVKRPWSKGGES